MQTRTLRHCAFLAVIAALGGCASTPSTQSPLATPAATRDAVATTTLDLAWLDGCDIYTRADNSLAASSNIPEVIFTYSTTSGGDNLHIQFTGDHGARIRIAQPPNMAGTSDWSTVLTLSTIPSSGDTLRIRGFDIGPNALSAVMSNAWTGAPTVPGYSGTGLVEPHKPRVRIIPIDGDKATLYIEYRDIVVRFLVKAP